jgi:membrane associated rhomboid family serine protease
MSTPDETPVGVPVCYRHPDRETYIRCGRCDRPICPDCMTSAAVGFQCPECVREGAKSVRPVRTRLGARVPTKPYVTYAIIAICVALFGLQFLAPNEPGTNFDTITAGFGMWPVGIALDDQYYRLLTSVFLHGSVIHIGMNMVFLYMLGPNLEYVLGHVRFAVLYLVSGLGGAVASFWFSSPNTVSVGASGAIFGLLGAYVVIGKRLNSDVTQVLVVIGINVAIGFFLGFVDWRAHLGGLLVGAVVALVLAYAPAKGRVLIQVLGVGAIVALLLVLVPVRDAQITQQTIAAITALHGSSG